MNKEELGKEASKYEDKDCFLIGAEFMRDEIIKLIKHELPPGALCVCKLCDLKRQIEKMGEA